MDLAEDETTFPSNGEVLFDASTSWDLDDDALTYSWASSALKATSSWVAPVRLPKGERTPQEGAPFTVNGNDTFGCSLGDGVHIITLQVCDPTHCVSLSRTIELVNLAPVLQLDFEPSLNPWVNL